MKKKLNRRLRISYTKDTIKGISIKSTTSNGKDSDLNKTPENPKKISSTLKIL
jgi:hypothetical protein